MRLFNDATEYGLRAMVWMTNQPRGPHKLQAIAEAIGATPCYLIKVLQLLTRAGIVSAHRGITGGYALVRDPETLTALEALSAIDPIERIERIRSCPLGPMPAGCARCISASTTRSSKSNGTLRGLPSRSWPCIDHRTFVRAWRFRMRSRAARLATDRNVL